MSNSVVLNGSRVNSGVAVVSRTVTSGVVGAILVVVNTSEVLASLVDGVAALVSGLKGVVASSVVMATAVVTVSSIVVSETITDVDSGLSVVSVVPFGNVFVEKITDVVGAGGSVTSVDGSVLAVVEVGASSIGSAVLLDDGIETVSLGVSS